jgi:hypothetical protein
MLQAVLTYLLVAVAAAWVVWTQFMPKALRLALKARFDGQKATPSGKSGCDCGGDGGCHD